MTRWLGLFVMACWLMGVAIGLRPTAQALPFAEVQGGGDNNTDGYLSNGGFEGNYYDVGAGQVAEGWTRVHLDGNPNWMSTQVFAQGGWVEKIGGENSQILSVENLGIGDPFETLLYQRVEGLQVGQTYSFSGWVLKMYGGSANPNPPEDPYAYGSWVGVDPTGGTDPNGETVIWGEQDWQTRRRGSWRNHRMAITAQSTSMTVFVRIWLKWQRAETQAIADAMELFDAPSVTLHTPSGTLQTPYLDWTGTLPDMLAQRGFYEMYYDVQKQAADGSWSTILSEVRDDSVALPLVEGESATLRVLPMSYQPEETVNWPPTTHVGHASEPITVFYGTIPATVQMSTANRWHDVTPFEVSWQAIEDNLPANLTYDVAYRQVGSETWQTWLTDTTTISATFGLNAQPVALVGGEEWQLQARVHPSGAWSEPINVALAEAVLRGQILAVNGETMPGMSLHATPYTFSISPTIDAQGNYFLPLPTSGTYTLDFKDQAGISRLPQSTLTITGWDGSQNWFLPPAVTRVSNGHFEDNLTDWSAQAQISKNAASGTQAAQLSANASISQTLTIEITDSLSLAWQPATAESQLQVRIGEESWLLTANEGQAGTWHYWYSEVMSEGEEVLTLSAVGGSVIVDEIAMGTPQPPTNWLYLPTVVR